MEDLEDFTYLVTIEDQGPFHFRELTPKDFYLAQLLRQKEENYLPLVLRLLLNEEILDSTSAKCWKHVLKWCYQTLLDQQLFTVENWLETAFHLCKQRWGSSIDWLEKQPVSKITLMIEVVKKVAEAEQDEIKKASRRRRR